MFKPGMFSFNPARVRFAWGSGNDFNQEQIIEQIVVKFDTSNKQWNSTVYRSIAEKISQVVQSSSMSAAYAYQPIFRLALITNLGVAERHGILLDNQ